MGPNAASTKPKRSPAKPRPGAERGLDPREVRPQISRLRPQRGLVDGVLHRASKPIADAAGAAIMCKLRQGARQAIRARLDVARDSDELATGSDTAILAAYFAGVIQGMAVQGTNSADARGPAPAVNPHRLPPRG